MRFTATLLTLAAASSTVLGAPAPDVSLAGLGSLLTRGLTGSRLAARQDVAGGIAALQQLAQDAISGASSGKCRSQCGGWTDALTACASNNAALEDVGQCACAPNTLSEMSPCAQCFDLPSAYSTFSGLCQQLLGATGGSTSAAGSSASASASSPSAEAASTTSAAAASTTSAAASTTSAAAASTTSAAAASTTTAAAAATTTTAAAKPASGAGQTTVMAGTAVGLMAAVVALLA